MSYEDHRQSLIVPYREPSQTKTWTTHDEISAQHTVEAPPNKIGDTQVYGGVEYEWNGEAWIEKES